MPRRFAVPAFVAGLLAAGLPAGPARAVPQPDTGNSDQPALIQADSVTHNRERNTVTARGDVEIARGGYILRADRIKYNRDEKMVTAIGNVSLLDPDGNVYFAEFFRLREDFKRGAARAIRLLLSDDSRMTAASGRLVAPVTHLKKVTYSPCEPCREDPDRPVLWRLRSESVTRDAKAKRMSHRDVTLQMGGIPVLYTPYLSHPTDEAERQTGLLTPSFGTKTDFGFFYKQGFFWAIDRDKDLTVDPTWFAKRNQLLLDTSYRQRFGNGSLFLRGMGTREAAADSATGEKRGRGAIDARLDVHQTPTWRWGGRLHRASDDTFLARYDFGSPSRLRSEAYAEGFRGLNYAAAKAYDFQSLRGGVDDDTVPLVGPVLTYDRVFRRGPHGSYWTYRGNAYSISRNEGRDTARLSNRVGWHLPYTSPNGSLWNLSATLQGDVYGTRDHRLTARRPDWSGTTGRLFPRTTLSWRYPMTRPHDGFSQVLEPIVAVHAAPNGGNPGKIPNEDSTDFEFAADTLFARSRFAGRDRVEPGQRVDYGVRWGVYGAGGGATEVLLGQSYRFQESSPFPAGSGLHDQVSDIVGTVHARPDTWYRLAYRFRLAKDDLTPRQQTIDLNATPGPFTFNLDYLWVAADSGVAALQDREEGTVKAGVQVTPHWSVAGHARRRFNDPVGMISDGARIGYEDECFAADLSYDRSYTRNRDVEPSTTVMLKVTFKTLGTLSQDIAESNN